MSVQQWPVRSRSCEQNHQAPVVTDVKLFGDIRLLREALFRKMDQTRGLYFLFQQSAVKLIRSIIGIMLI